MKVYIFHKALYASLQWASRNVTAREGDFIYERKRKTTDPTIKSLLRGAFELVFDHR